MYHTESRSVSRGLTSRRARPTAQRPAPFGALLRYAVVGVGNTVVSFVTFVLLTSAGAPAPLAAALGFAAGASHGYFVNSRWTFRTPTGIRSGSVYAGVQGLGMLLTAVLVAFQANHGFPDLVADLVAMPIVTLATYELNARWAFSSRSATSPRNASAG